MRVVDWVTVWEAKDKKDEQHPKMDVKIVYDVLQIMVRAVTMAVGSMDSAGKMLVHPRTNFNINQPQKSDVRI